MLYFSVCWQEQTQKMLQELRNAHTCVLLRKGRLALNPLLVSKDAWLTGCLLMIYRNSWMSASPAV